MYGSVHTFVWACETYIVVDALWSILGLSLLGAAKTPWCMASGRVCRHPWKRYTKCPEMNFLIPESKL